MRVCAREGWRTPYGVRVGFRPSPASRLAHTKSLCGRLWVVDCTPFVSHLSLALERVAHITILHDIVTHVGYDNIWGLHTYIMSINISSCLE